MICKHTSLRGERYVGDPVDVTSGANVDVALEFRLASPANFVWQRYYNSALSSTQRSLGWGHTHEYDHRLTVDIDGLTYLDPKGVSVSFDVPEKPGAVVTSGSYRLTLTSPGVYSMWAPGSFRRLVFGFTDGARQAQLLEMNEGAGRLQFSYGERGLKEILLADIGQSVAFMSDAQGRIVSLTLHDPKRSAPKHLISYEYDAAGNLVRGVDSYRAVFSFSYDAQNRMTSRTDRNGYTMRFEYDGDGRCVCAGGEDGVSEVRLRYLTKERVTAVTEADGGEWTYFHNEGGHVTQIINPVGGARVFKLNELGDVEQETDAAGAVTHYLYDSTGELSAKISPLGIRYSPDDEPPPAYQPHRLPENAREYEFGTLGGFTAKESVSDFVANRLDAKQIEILTAELPTASEKILYDRFGTAARETVKSGATRRWIYDANLNIVQEHDFNGGIREFAYESWNHLVREKDAEGNLTKYSYSKTEKLISVIDPGGTEQKYSRNLLGEVSEVYRHGEMLESYEYDPAGNFILKRDRKGVPLLRFEIGAGNVIAARHLTSGDVHRFQHTAEGRILSANSRAGKVEFAYDDLGQRIKDFRDGRGIEHSYEGADQRSALLGRFKTSYERRLDGTIRITDPTGAVHRVRFPYPGVVAREHSNGSWEFTRFDKAGNICAKLARQGLGSNETWRRVYEWSPDGDLLEIKDNHSGHMQVQYDRAHRLRSTTLGGKEEKFAYDAAGNLLQAPGLAGVTLQTGNRLAEANGDHFEYNGRDHIAKRSGLRGKWEYHYDSRDMLVRIDADGKEFWSSTYDALGRRVSKTVDGKTTQYFWDTDRLAAELDACGRLRVYLYLAPLALTPFMFVDYESVDAAPESGTVYFVFSNHLGAPVLVEDVKRNIVWRCSYSAYGAAEIDPGSKIELNLRFPGHYFDAETNLHYNRFRYYSPELGRYLQCDPEGIDGGLNLYAYTGNPLVEVDVRGLNCPKHGEAKDPNCEDCKNADKGRKPGEGVKVEAKWGNPKSTKAYGHSVSEHGAQRPPQELKDRARSTGNPQGQWSNNNLIVEAEQRAPLAPGAHVVEMGKPAGNVYLPDGTTQEGVTRAVVVRNDDLTVKTSYPIPN